MQLFKIIKFLLIFILLSVKSVHANPNVTIEEIFKTYESNVARFDLKYKGKQIEIIATMKRVISLDESLNYKESSRKRWGYLSEFMVNQRKIICFSDDAKSAAYSTPNELAFITGFLADIDDNKMIITYCSAKSPKNAAALLSNLSAKEALEKAMLCDQYFEPSVLWEKLIDEKYIKSSMVDIYWEELRVKEIEEYEKNKKNGVKNIKNYYDSDYPKVINLNKKLDFYGLEVDYIYGYDRERNRTYKGGRAFTNITIIFNKNTNLSSAVKLLKNKLDLEYGNPNYFGKNNYTLENDNILLLSIGSQDERVKSVNIKNRVSLKCLFIWDSKWDLKTY